MKSRLTDLQRLILKRLSGIHPPWTLVGGAALAEFHLGRRTTRDLDLFWRGRERLGDLARKVETELENAGLGIRAIQSDPAFCRFKVEGQDEVVVLDLVAESAAAILEAEVRDLDGSPIRVAGTREILASKLCALMNRSEPRDLADVEGLLETGGDLETAAADAAEIDTGFSPLILAWVLEKMDVARLAEPAGLDPEEAGLLDRFRESLVARLLGLAGPEMLHGLPER